MNELAEDDEFKDKDDEEDEDIAQMWWKALLAAPSR